MKPRSSTKVAAAVPLLAALLLPSLARAGGFSIAEHGTAATGMVGAFAAKADDISTIFFNPAGLAQQHKLQVYVGGLMILGQAKAEGTAGFPMPEQKAKFLAQPIGTFYLAYGLPHDFAVGIGVYANFGLKVEWPTDFPGRFVGRYVNLQTVTINPTIAWRPVRWLSLGVGLDLTPASVDLQRSLNLVDAEAQLRFRANDLGVGGNVGILLEGPILKHRHRPLLALGISYRSAFDFSFDGAFQPTAPPEFSQALRASPASARLRLPDQLAVGFGVRPIDRLFLQVQFDWVRWSRLQSLQLEVQDNPSQNLTLPEQWSSGYTLRVGGELELGRWRPRLGLGYDWAPTPVKTLGPFIPDSSRFLVSGGLGVMDLRRVALELSLMGVIFQQRTSELAEFPVKYSNWALLISGAISYRGDRPGKAKPKNLPNQQEPVILPAEPTPPPPPPPVLPPPAEQQPMN